MSQIAEYILAKKTLAELDACPFGDSRMMPVELADDRVYGYLGRPAKPVIANLIGEGSLFSLLGTSYGLRQTECWESFLGDFIGASLIC